MSGIDSGRRPLGHSEFREWQELAMGDSRQVYARRAGAASDEPLVFMADGEANLLRPKAKSGALICPVPGCPSPELNTRACEDRRDHFTHVVAPGGKEHREKYLKIANERLLIEWARDQKHVRELSRVSLKEPDGTERISFILTATLKEGGKVALCYVDRRLGADAWKWHHEVLRADGFAPAWIFALGKSYFKPPDPANPVERERTDLILDKAIYRRMRGNGAWPLLINPEQKELANVLKPGGRMARRLRLEPTRLDRVQHVYRSKLHYCRLCPYGLQTPAVGEYFLRESFR